MKNILIFLTIAASIVFNAGTTHAFQVMGDEDGYSSMDSGDLGQSMDSLTGGAANIQQGYSAAAEPESGTDGDMIIKSDTGYDINLKNRNLIVNPSIDINGDIYVENGNVKLSGANDIKGNITVLKGNLIIGDACDISGSVKVSGNIEIGGASEILGPVTITSSNKNIGGACNRWRCWSKAIFVWGVH